MNQPEGKRARRRAEIEQAIPVLARRQLAEVGAASLSVRQIARELGMTSSAIYRYVADRDELLTRLIVESYGQLNDAAQTAHDAAGPEPRPRVRAIVEAVRAWALDHPHDWALLYGSPVPDYHAPSDRTTGPGTAVSALMLRALSDAYAAGETVAFPDDADLGEMANDPLLADLGLPSGAIAAGITVWLLVLGAVSAEVFGQLGADAPASIADHAFDTAERLLFS